MPGYQSALSTTIRPPGARAVRARWAGARQSPSTTITSKTSSSAETYSFLPVASRTSTGARRLASTPSVPTPVRSRQTRRACFARPHQSVEFPDPYSNTVFSEKSSWTGMAIASRCTGRRIPVAVDRHLRPPGRRVPVAVLENTTGELARILGPHQLASEPFGGGRRPHRFNDRKNDRQCLTERPYD